MPFYKRRWDESRDDAYDRWGCSWWYFEADLSGLVARQIEVYDTGPTLRYDNAHEEGPYGGLAQASLWENEAEKARFEEIPQDQFEALWMRAAYAV